MLPPWLSLLAPLPGDAVPERRPVVSPGLAASEDMSAIAGWESVSVHLSAGEAGLRHVLVTLDGGGKLLSAGDNVLFHRKERRAESEITVYDQESIGGRYEDDGSFHGTRWLTHTEQHGEEEEDAVTTATPSAPSDEDVAALNRLVADVLRRMGLASGS